MNREEYRAVQMFAIGLVLAMVARVWGDLRATDRRALHGFFSARRRLPRGVRSHAQSMSPAEIAAEVRCGWR